MIPLGSLGDMIEKQAREELFAKYTGHFLSDNSDAVLMVKRVTRRLIKANNLPDRDWRVFVISDPTPNAFVTPGVCCFA